MLTPEQKQQRARMVRWLAEQGYVPTRPPTGDPELDSYSKARDASSGYGYVTLRFVPIRPIQGVAWGVVVLSGSSEKTQLGWVFHVDQMRRIHDAIVNEDTSPLHRFDVDVYSRYSISDIQRASDAFDRRAQERQAERGAIKDYLRAARTERREREQRQREVNQVGSAAADRLEVPEHLTWHGLRPWAFPEPERNLTPDDRAFIEGLLTRPANQPAVAPISRQADAWANDLDDMAAYVRRQGTIGWAITLETVAKKLREWGDGDHNQ